VKKLFGGINLTWKKLVMFSILAGTYTALMAILPITNNTSFADITVSFEVWILFGILIIMNSKSSKDSALKCFVFFLISQPLIYLLQVPFSWQGWGLFKFYRYWFMWTIACLPMGFIGYYMKKNKWWSALILIPMLFFLGNHYRLYLGETLFNFPHHLLSTLFCAITMIFYPIFIFNDKKPKMIAFIVSILIFVFMSGFTLLNRTVYNTIVLVSDEETIVFDDSYKVYLDNDKFGSVKIVYDDNLEDYRVDAEFKKAGKTKIVLEDTEGNKTIYDIDIKRDSFDLKKEVK